MGEDLKQIGKFKPEEYWEWRTSVSEWKKAEEELKIRQLQYILMEKEIEISRLKMQLYKINTEDYKATVTRLKTEYDDFKQKMEKKHKISLNDCIIGDDLTISRIVKE
jgi:hypothetical protein